MKELSEEDNRRRNHPIDKPVEVHMCTNNASTKSHVDDHDSRKLLSLFGGHCTTPPENQLEMVFMNPATGLELVETTCGLVDDQTDESAEQVLFPVLSGAL
jgi:hypothetical protein